MGQAVQREQMTVESARLRRRRTARTVATIRNVTRVLFALRRSCCARCAPKHARPTTTVPAVARIVGSLGIATRWSERVRRDRRRIGLCQERLILSSECPGFVSSRLRCSWRSLRRLHAVARPRTGEQAVRAVKVARARRRHRRTATIAFVTPIVTRAWSVRPPWRCGRFVQRRATAGLTVRKAAPAMKVLDTVGRLTELGAAEFHAGPARSS